VPYHILTGDAIIESDRIDLFDVWSNRTGSGPTRDGGIETFDRQGDRTGVGRWPAERRR